MKQCSRIFCLCMLDTWGKATGCGPSRKPCVCARELDVPFNIHPPPPGDDQPDGPIMGTTLQPEIQDGHGTFIPGIDHATRPFMVTFTTVIILLHLSPHTGFVSLYLSPAPYFCFPYPLSCPTGPRLLLCFHDRHAHQRSHPEIAMSGRACDPTTASHA